MEKQEAADIHLDRTEEGYIACSSFFMGILTYKYLKILGHKDNGAE